MPQNVPLTGGWNAPVACAVKRPLARRTGITVRQSGLRKPVLQRSPTAGSSAGRGPITTGRRWGRRGAVPARRRGRGLGVGGNRSGASAVLLPWGQRQPAARAPQRPHPLVPHGRAPYVQDQRGNGWGVPQPRQQPRPSVRDQRPDEADVQRRQRGALAQTRQRRDRGVSHGAVRQVEGELREPLPRGHPRVQQLQRNGMAVPPFPPSSAGACLGTPRAPFQGGGGGSTGLGGGPAPPPPVWHSVRLLLLYGALDSPPVFPPHVASGRCFLSAAAASALAGVVSTFTEPSSWCAGAVLNVAWCAVCVSAAPNNWRIGGCAGCCRGRLTVFAAHTPPSTGRPYPPKGGAESLEAPETPKTFLSSTNWRRRRQRNVLIGVVERSPGDAPDHPVFENALPASVPGGGGGVGGGNKIYCQ